ADGHQPRQKPAVGARLRSLRRNPVVGVHAAAQAPLRRRGAEHLRGRRALRGRQPMSQFTSGFWDVYIAIITVLSIAACALLLRSQSKARAPGAKTETTGHVWDEDLGEYNNPLPRWWSWLFYLTIVFGVVYLILYPGLGSWRGTLGWSQISQLQEETAAAERLHGPLYERFAKVDIADLARDPEALAIGQKLFLNNCAQCHAS